MHAVYLIEIKWNTENSVGKKLITHAQETYCPVSMFPEDRGIPTWKVIINIISRENEYKNNISFGYVRFFMENAPVERMTQHDQFEIYEGTVKVADIFLLKEQVGGEFLILPVYPVKIEWIPEDKGGRKTIIPVGTTYYPTSRFPVSTDDITWSVVIKITDHKNQDEKNISLGFVRFLMDTAPEEWFTQYNAFEIYEGPRKVADVFLLQDVN